MNNLCFHTSSIDSNLAWFGWLPEHLLIRMIGSRQQPSATSSVIVEFL